MRGFIIKYGKWLTVSEKDLDSSLRTLQRWGYAMVLFSHLIPLSVVRVIVSIFAGVNRMRWWHFAAYTTIGTILWIGGQLYVAVILGENWDELLAKAEPYELYFWMGGVVLGVLFIVWYVHRLRRQNANNGA